MITIKDIAKTLGVSYSTVSRCLNDDKTVSLLTKEKVLNEAKRVGFIFNNNARNLIKNKSDKIGIIFSNNFNEVSKRWFFNEISGHCIYAIENKRYNFIIQPNQNIHGESNVFKLISGREVDGLIIASRNFSPEEYSFLINNKIPHVFIYFKPYFIEGELENLFYDDNEYGGYIATKYFIEKKHEKILTITSSDKSLKMYSERTKGYLRAMNEKGLESLVLECPHMNFEYQEKFLKENLNTILSCTGIFAQQDLVALGLIKNLIKFYNLEIPKDISFVGYNNIDLIKYLDIPLTTIEDPRAEVINNAVEYLIEKINKREINENIKNKLYPSIVIRESVKEII